MSTHSNTRYRVVVNPDSVRAVPISFLPMAAKRKVASALENIARENMKKLVQKHYDGKRGRVHAKNPNVVLSRFQEFLDGGGCTLASLQPWADALHVKPWQLLVPNLDVDDLPEIVTNKRLKMLQRLSKELLEEER